MSSGTAVMRQSRQIMELESQLHSFKMRYFKDIFELKWDEMSDRDIHIFQLIIETKRYINDDDLILTYFKPNRDLIDYEERILQKHNDNKKYLQNIVKIFKIKYSLSE